MNWNERPLALKCTPFGASLTTGDTGHAFQDVCAARGKLFRRSKEVFRDDVAVFEEQFGMRFVIRRTVGRLQYGQDRPSHRMRRPFT